MDDLKDMDRDRLVAMIRQLRGEGEPTHAHGVRELFRAREQGTGRLKVVYTEPGQPRPQVADARFFETMFERLVADRVPDIRIGEPAVREDGVSWECRKCRSLIEDSEPRFPVSDDQGRGLGEWCGACSTS